MTQSDAQALIARMVERYPPPQHLRGQPEAQAAVLADYEQALAPFDADTLAKGWAKVVSEHAFWVWPNPGTMAEACRHCQPKPPPPTQQEQRRAKALEMADAYTARYCKRSHLAKLAKQEGWMPKLHEYVAAAAWLQAQLICQVQPIGWDKLLLPDADRYRSSQAAFEALRQTIAPQIEKGTIRVHIPPARIRQWKDQTPFHRAAGC
jgi:hypothetical protein